MPTGISTSDHIFMNAILWPWYHFDDNALKMSVPAIIMPIVSCIAVENSLDGPYSQFEEYLIDNITGFLTFHVVFVSSWPCVLVLYLYKICMF